MCPKHTPFLCAWVLLHCVDHLATLFYDRWGQGKGVVAMNNDLLRGKVALILNEREIVINIGAEQGVKPGMKFKVLADTPTEILDPDTQLKIGVVSTDDGKLLGREGQVQGIANSQAPSERRVVAGGKGGCIGSNIYPPHRSRVVAQQQRRAVACAGANVENRLARAVLSNELIHSAVVGHQRILNRFIFGGV